MADGAETPTMVRRTFGHADEHPYRRLTADFVKLPVAAGLFVASALHVGNETTAERRLVQLFVGLPERVSDFCVRSSPWAPSGASPSS
jgi:hypothetical protein